MEKKKINWMDVFEMCYLVVFICILIGMLIMWIIEIARTYI